MSEAVTVNANRPASVGLPAIVPVGPSATPVGRAPELSAHVNVPVPPVALSGNTNGTPTSDSGVTALATRRGRGP